MNKKAIIMVKEHYKILELAADNKIPRQIDESSNLSVDIVSELIDAGYLKAIDATSFDGIAFLQTKITLSGREYLNTLKTSLNSPGVMLGSGV